MKIFLVESNDSGIEDGGGMKMEWENLVKNAFFNAWVSCEVVIATCAVSAYCDTKGEPKFKFLS